MLDDDDVGASEIPANGSARPAPAFEGSAPANGSVEARAPDPKKSELGGNVAVDGDAGGDVAAAAANGSTAGCGRPLARLANGSETGACAAA